MKKIGIEIFDETPYSYISDDKKQEYIDAAYQDIEDCKNNKSRRRKLSKDVVPMSKLKELKERLPNKKNKKEVMESFKKDSFIPILKEDIKELQFVLNYLNGKKIPTDKDLFVELVNEAQDAYVESNKGENK